MSNNPPDITLALTHEQAALVYTVIKATQSQSLEALMVVSNSGTRGQCERAVELIELAKGTVAAIEKSMLEI